MKRVLIIVLSAIVGFISAHCYVKYNESLFNLSSSSFPQYSTPFSTPPQSESEDVPRHPAFVMELLDVHNSYRSKPLELDEDLMEFAQDWAEDMTHHRRPHHSDMDFPGNWRSYGENIAWGQNNVDTVMNVWMHSSGHRKNIKNPSFTHVGFGMAENTSGSKYWCVCFGTK